MEEPNSKLKIRTSKKIILIFAEGLRDVMFVKYLKSLYLRTNEIDFRIRNGMGGTANGIVMETINSLGSYDKRVTIVDNDKNKSEMEKARLLAKNNNIELIEITPCIEAMFLCILLDNLSNKLLKTGKCKCKYEKDFLKKSGIEDQNDLIKLFPKKLLTSRRKNILTLDLIIRLIEGK